jgi:hypothetical protein
MTSSSGAHGKTPPTHSERDDAKGGPSKELDPGSSVDDRVGMNDQGRSPSILNDKNEVLRTVHYRGEPEAGPSSEKVGSTNAGSEKPGKPRNGCAECEFTGSSLSIGPYKQPDCKSSLG